MTKLSVNINKIATIRNARGGDTPNVVQAAIQCERFGAQGITVHPRPDERHIRYADVYDLKDVLTTEFNIEGYPSEAFVQLVLDAHPAQVTLVPDPPGVLTSNAGWQVRQHEAQLRDVIGRFKSAGIRVSIFVETDQDNIRAAAEVGADRVELYTESYATAYAQGRGAEAVQPFAAAAGVAQEVGLGVNAGHDLNLDNLRFFAQHVQPLAEVSIGHALISDALYMGLETTIQEYRKQLDN